MCETLRVKWSQFVAFMFILMDSSADTVEEVQTDLSSGTFYSLKSN